MSETWQVIDDKGAAHEARVTVGDDDRTTASIGDESLTFSEGPSPRVAALRIAAWCRIEVAEVLAPGQVSAARLRVVAQAAATLVLWHDANTPDGDLNGADGHLWAMIDALRAAGYRMPTGTPTGPTRAEMAAEVAHLEARRGALLAEIDRLHALDRDAGVVIEDLRKMLAEANAAVATARADGAREMRERAAVHFDARARAADQSAASLGRYASAQVIGAALDNSVRLTETAEAIRALPLPGEEVARG